MVKFDKNSIVYTSKRPFHRVAVAYGCSRNTAKKYIGWAVCFSKYPDRLFIGDSWICFEDYRDFRTWKRQQKEKRGTVCTK